MRPLAPDATLGVMDLVSTSVAAREIGVSPRSLARWAREGSVTPAQTTPGGWMRWDLPGLRRQLSTTTRTEGAPVMSSTTQPEPQPVVAAVLTDGDRMLVTWRNDESPPVGFLSGEIEPGESAADAMVRECKEEAGLRVEVVGEIGRRVHPRSHRLMIYVAGRPVGETDVFVGDVEELAAVRWVTLGEAVEAFAAFGGMFPPVHKYLADALA